MATKLTILRVILTAVVVWAIAAGASVFVVLGIFAAAALTDLLDGILARKYGQVTRFGARADMVADRILWVGTALAIVWIYGAEGRVGVFEGIQLAAMFSRESLAAPITLWALTRGRAFPPTKYIAKLTTFIQGFALSALLLSLFYPSWSYLSVPLSAVLLVTGTWSAATYLRNVRAA